MGVRAVFLVGFMGSGKNTIGRELAHRLGWSFVDLDRQIEGDEGQTISEIFRAKGELGFRKAETSTLRDVLSTRLTHDSIIALGGGAFAQEHNRRLLQHWPTVFLDAPVDELWRRCQQDDVERPLQGDRNQFARLYAERLPFYREASLSVETHSKDVASICSEIESALQLRGGSKDSTTRADQRIVPNSSPTDC